MTKKAVSQKVLFNESYRDLEAERKKGLLNIFSKITIAIAVFGLLTTGISTFTQTKNIVVTVLSLTTLLICACFSYKLSKTSWYVLASWLLIIPLLLLFSIVYIQFGTSLPLFAGFLLPIAITSVLLTVSDTIIILVVSIVFNLAIIILYDIAKIAQPFETSTPQSQSITVLFFVLVIFPALTALITLPARTQAKTLKTQNRQLEAALSELNSRQHQNSNMGQEMESVVLNLRNVSLQQVSGSHEQASAITQITSSLGELSATAANIAELSQEVNTLTELMKLDSQRVESTTTLSVFQSKEGLTAITHTISACREVAELYQGLLYTLQDLNAKGSNMRRILELLESISNETHLLSLNAAIEAAGAGEFGERFGVVAQEVKKLAFRSNKANQEVVAIIAEIEQAASNAVISVDDGYRKTQQMERVAGDAGAIIEAISRVSEESQHQVNSISRVTQDVSRLSQIIKIATNQQQSASEQVLSSLTGVKIVAHQSAEASSLVSDTAQQLELLSKNLNRSLILK